MTVRGIYRNGQVRLLERPEGGQEGAVAVTLANVTDAAREAASREARRQLALKRLERESILEGVLTQPVTNFTIACAEICRGRSSNSIFCFTPTIARKRSNALERSHDRSTQRRRRTRDERPVPERVQLRRAPQRDPDLGGSDQG
jgi:hypothetical protein